jgi:D-beta-D-heptose 7-phosphate kinase/D-beta-D-heptose 1-phosphate adenosyltransferase
MWKIISAKKFWLKFILVKGRTSLQSHNERTEWHFGLYKVPPREKHRLLKGAYFELAYGKPKEEDIVRYEDDYGREAAGKIIAVSGGFDPIHIGHVRLFKEAKKQGDKLYVILNNDNWLAKKKGKAFMTENERKEILLNLESVDEVILTNHPENPADMSVCEELKILKPHIFANGGDRKANNIPEYKLCEKLGIEMVFNVGGEKVRSSSELLGNYAKEDS